MAVQYSTAVRNARLDSIETTIGTTPILRIRSGAPPAAPATADSGTLLAEINLPSDWMAAASNGTKALAGSWADVGITEGEAGHFRIFNSGDTDCHMQGTVTGAGGGGDIELDNANIATDQDITITAFSITEGNA